MIVQRVQTTSVFSNGQSFVLKYSFFFCHFSGFCYLFCKVLRGTWVDTSLFHISNCTAQRVFAKRCVSRVELQYRTQHDLPTTVPPQNPPVPVFCDHRGAVEQGGSSDDAFDLCMEGDRFESRPAHGLYWFKALRGPTSHSAPHSTSYWQHS